MTILGIETSCDETAAAVYGDKGLISNVITSQAIHQPFGGVVPELASRMHVQLIVPIVKKALRDAKVSISDIDGIAVTCGPGLVGSILVGLNFAKALAYSQRLPWVGVNHIEGHIFANFIDRKNLESPFVVLIISGGHTQLVYVKQLGVYQILGKTRDDAAGEAYDKIAKMMNLGYPGGPIIDKQAKMGDESFVDFPRAMLGEDNFDFSFSGLKTAVLYYLQGLDRKAADEHINDIVASFQAALVDVLIEKTINAAKKMKIKSIALAGGVACNSYLRKKMEIRAESEEMKLFVPSPILCTDNAAMIACAGFFKLQRGERASYDLSPKPALMLNS